MKRGYCHCGAPIIGMGMCAFRCSVYADPAWLALQEAKRREREAHRRREERIFITQEDLRRVRRAVKKFDKVYAAQSKRGRKAALKRYGVGGGA